MCQWLAWQLTSLGGMSWKEIEFRPKWGLIGFRLELFTTRRSTPHIVRLTLNKSSCTCLRHQVLPPVNPWMGDTDVGAMTTRRGFAFSRADVVDPWEI